MKTLKSKFSLHASKNGTLRSDTKVIVIIIRKSNDYRSVFRTHWNINHEAVNYFCKRAAS